jgi:hypothetical protein
MSRHQYTDDEAERIAEVLRPVVLAFGVDPDEVYIEARTDGITVTVTIG